MLRNGRYPVCAAIVAAVIAVFGPAWSAGFESVFPDSSSYVAVGESGIASGNFWFGQRPPTYPVFLLLIGSSSRAVVVAQILVAVMSWAFLLATAWKRLRNRWIAAAVVAALLLVAVQARFAFWHAAVLTESLSGSLAVASIAAWWRWFAAPNRSRLVGATGLTIAWMLLRDSNAVSFLVVAVPALAGVVFLERTATGLRRRGMVIALSGVVLAGAFSLLAQAASDRGETSFHNNVGLRWLPDDEMRSWMVDRGMPESPALLDRTNRDAWADGEAFLRSPELADYRAWASGSGRWVAATSFVVRAPWYVDRFWRDLPALTSTDHLGYDTHGVADRLPKRPLGLLDPTGSRFGLAAWALLVVEAGALVLRRRRDMAWLIPFWFVPVLFDLYLSYAGDAIEVGRHLVGPLLRFEVVAIVSVGLAADVAMSNQVRRSTSAPV